MNLRLGVCRCFSRCLVLLGVLCWMPLPGWSQSEAKPDLRRQIARMLIVGFRGTGPELSAEMREAVSEVGVGGVILFEWDAIRKSRPRNIVSREQVSALTAELKGAAKNPLLVMIDQEGGRVNRLKERYGYPKTVSALYLGSLSNEDSTLFYAERIADMVASSGFNLNAAPCLDLNVNPSSPAIGAMERSFSADPEKTARMAEIFYDRQKAHGVLSVYKHFPGHGSATTDSHLGFTDVTETWSEMELRPYELLLKAGKCDAIMTSHVFNAHLDPEFPATLSRNIVTGLLRERLGFEGVVVSDDMAMQAITDHWDLKTALYRAIDAGVDLLILSNQGAPYNAHIARDAVDIVVELIHEGKLSESRIRESYDRIERLLERIGLPDHP